MKIVMNKALRLGLKRYAEGDEIDMPDRFAQKLVTSGMAAQAKDKPARKVKKAEEPVEEEKPRNYKTRQIKAEGK